MEIKNNLFFKRFLVICATAYIFIFFSEYLFVNEQPAFHLISTLTTNSLGLFFLVELILWYVFFVYIFFIAIDKFNVRSIWALFLAGSLYGWWNEGVVIPILYEALPFSISRTSLGWHALIDVLVGFFLVRKILHKNNYWYTTFLSLAIGSFWGVRATWYWVEGAENIIPSDFLLYTLFTTILLIISYIIIDKINLASIKITKTEIRIFIVLSLLSLGFQTTYLSFIPWVTLLPLTAITFWALGKNKKIENRPNIYENLVGETKITNYSMLIIIPFVASIIYYALYTTQTNLHIVELVWLFFMPAGFIIFLIAFFKVILVRKK